MLESQLEIIRGRWVDGERKKKISAPKNIEMNQRTPIDIQEKVQISQERDIQVWWQWGGLQHRDLEAKCHGLKGVNNGGSTHVRVYECRKEQSWYMSYPSLCFSTVLHLPFSFYWFSFILLLEAWGAESMMCMIYQWLPLKVGQCGSSLTRGWDIHGFLNDARGNHRGPKNQRNGHNDKGWKSCLAFSHVLNFIVPTIFCIFWYYLLFMSPYYAFILLF